MNILTKITNLGVSEHLNQYTIKRIRIVNQISFYVFILSLFTLTTTFLIDFPRITAVFFLPFTILSPLSPILNKMGMTIASRIVPLCLSCAILMLQAIVFGPELNFQLFLIAVVGAPLLLFDKEIGDFKWMLALMPFAVWIYLEWHFIHNDAIIVLDPDAIYWQRLFNHLMLFSIIFFMFFTFTKQNNKQIRNIELQRLAIETLLREIHHRVKNNLQVITSLLALQAMGIKEKKVKNLFHDLQHRIQSMALSHEMLYQTEDLQRINYEEYIRKLTTGLINSMKITEKTVDVQLNIKNVFLNIDTATPLGLIINEVVTNSLKYAFQDNSGCITINLKKLEYPNFLLEIGDNGVGYTDTKIQKNAKSLGLSLIQKLTLQLKGAVVKDNSKKGTHYIINFQEIKSN